MQHIPYQPVASGHMNGQHYDHMSRTLYLRYKNGYEYAVHGFEPTAHQAFLNAPSQGEHFHQVIKGNYEVERIK